MKSKVAGIHPEGATLTRADGSAVNIGDEIGDNEALTITLASPTQGGSIVVGPSFNGTVRERFTDAAPVAPALAVGDGSGVARKGDIMGPIVGRPSRVAPSLKVE